MRGERQDISLLLILVMSHPFWTPFIFRASVPRWLAFFELR